ncbi:tagaturonate reductase [Butyrivibrio sp. VCD2006]|uniref:tagaturonate reductase n=1 Tax=Butyrivibrio sp. VCD2006 TaxID=1280664 RepID=UPI0004000B73|nr:tagaturonate reductase [Butyrivibrio sp. VCD2006]
MEKLSYKLLEESGYDGFLLKDAPEKVLQFGEGNFLRAFVDYFIDVMNEKADFNGKVVLCQPIEQGLSDMINDQEGLYTLFLRGQENGQKVNKKRVISSVSRCLNPYKEYDKFIECVKNPDIRFIVSNTTEAGIAYDPACKLDDKPASSFPGKLTQLLYERFQNKLPGFIILSCELIDRNGDELLKCVKKYIEQWELSDEFLSFVENENVFCSTLVDRIVPGYPRAEAESICEELGYKDNLIDTAEVFGAWVIEGPASIEDEFPAKKAELPIIVVDNVDPYKKRKVRILNGAHTSMIMGAFLAGQDIVRDCMKDEVIKGYMNKALYSEIIPVLKGLEKKDLEDFAAAVSDRFANPFIDHELLSISLNSCSKWKARVMPTVLEYFEQKKELPKVLTFSFAAFLEFYHQGFEKRDGALVAKRGDKEFLIKDDEWVLDEFLSLKDADAKTLAKTVIENEKMWGSALKDLTGFEDKVTEDLLLIREKGMYEAMKEVQGE